MFSEPAVVRTVLKTLKTNLLKGPFIILSLPGRMSNNNLRHLPTLTSLQSQMVRRHYSRSS